MAHWFGWMALAVGLPCWMQGLLMDLEMAAMLAELTASYSPSESTQRTSEWVNTTHWLAPYLLWIGGALTLLGGLLGVIGLVWRKSDDNVGAPADDERHLHP